MSRDETRRFVSVSGKNAPKLTPLHFLAVPAAHQHHRLPARGEYVPAARMYAGGCGAPAGLALPTSSATNALPATVLAGPVRPLPRWARAPGDTHPLPADTRTGMLSTRSPVGFLLAKGIASPLGDGFSFPLADCPNERHDQTTDTRSPSPTLAHAY
jgi:hypothetical protein